MSMATVPRAAATAARRTTCRYLSRRTGNQCTAEAVGGEHAEILLCTAHLALALELINARMSSLRPGGRS